MTDWLVILATLLSPLIAVQVTKWLDRRHQAREEQIRIFKTLMATRAAPLDPRHVESLNVIDVVFNANEKKQVEIRRLWKQYLDHLRDRNYPAEVWGKRRVELLVELLHVMAVHLGFDFDKTHIKNETYFPDGYGALEDENAKMRRSVLEVLEGKRFLPMYVVNLPPQETTTVTPTSRVIE
jgi:hypothetical protein